MVLMALQVWGIFNFVPSSYAVSKNKKVRSIGAFLAGILGGLFSSPCSTPVLVVILGTSTSTLRKITNSNNYGLLI